MESNGKQRRLIANHNHFHFCKLVAIHVNLYNFIHMFSYTPLMPITLDMFKGGPSW